MCIKREAPSLTHFFVSCPLSHFLMHTHMQICRIQYMCKPNYTYKCANTHPHIYTHCNTLRAPSAYYKKNILQRDKKNKKKTIIKIHRRGLLRGRTFIRCRWLCFPLGLLSGCLISFRGVLWSWGAAATQKSFLKFLHHRFLSIFQLCTLLHLPPEEHQSAQHQPF